MPYKRIYRFFNGRICFNCPGLWTDWKWENLYVLLNRMAGNEENISSLNYKKNDTDGIIPQAAQYLWECMNKSNTRFFVKASFMEIYNEQIGDLLNQNSGILHCRWNVKNVYLIRDFLLKI